MLSKFLDPKNDVAFKKIFGTEKNKDILIHFLNDMLKFRAQKPITEVTFLKTIQDPEIAAKKTSIVDILCQDEFGNSYVVEMQVAKTMGFEKRAQYYAAKAYTSQMNKGQKYHTLKEVIFLAIADFTMFPEKSAYKSDHVVLDKETYERDLRDFSFTFLELSKFKKGKEELDNVIDKWAYYFKHADETPESDIHTIFEKDVVIQKAYSELNRFSWNDDELRAYESVIKKDADYQASIDQKFYEGKAEGIAEGMAKGEAKGITKGKAEGQREVAIKMLQANMDIATVSKISGLSENDILSIKSKA